MLAAAAAVEVLADGANPVQITTTPFVRHDTVHSSASLPPFVGLNATALLALRDAISNHSVPAVQQASLALLRDEAANAMELSGSRWVRSFASRAHFSALATWHVLHSFRNALVVALVSVWLFASTPAVSFVVSISP